MWLNKCFLLMVPFILFTVDGKGENCKNLRSEKGKMSDGVVEQGCVLRGQSSQG